MKPEIQQILEKIKECSLEIWKENLAGIYVHGSLAFGCFNWNKSDIDFIIVTHKPPNLEEKEKFIMRLLDLDQICPPGGLEMSIVLEENCRNFVYPTPFELHFSNMHKLVCRTNLRKYCMHMNGTDKDLAAHFTVIKKAGITVYGDPKETAFGEVPKGDYLDSIRHDIWNAAEKIKENPVYIILNLCRALAYTKDGKVLSKQQGALWAMEHVPGRFCALINQAGECYGSARPFKAGLEEALLPVFAGYMIGQIFPD